MSGNGAVHTAVGNVVPPLAPAAEPEEEPSSPLQDAVRGAFTPLTAAGFMIFVLLYMPCVVVAIAMRQEFGGWKWFGVAFAYQSALAWTMALLVYQGGRLLGLGS